MVTFLRRHAKAMQERSKAGKAGKACGGNNSPTKSGQAPRAPLVPLKAAPFGGAGVRVQDELRRSGAWKGGNCGCRCAWRARFGLRTQCRCVLTDPPVVADSCPAFAGQSCQRKGFPDFWEGAPWSGPQMKTGKPSLNALGPRATSGARPTGISRRDSLPPLNAMPVVQVPQAEQCVLGKRAGAALGRRKEKRKGEAEGGEAIGKKQPRGMNPGEVEELSRGRRRVRVFFAVTARCGPPAWRRQ